MIRQTSRRPLTSSPMHAAAGTNGGGPSAARRGPQYADRRQREEDSRILDELRKHPADRLVLQLGTATWLWDLIEDVLASELNGKSQLRRSPKRPHRQAS